MVAFLALFIIGSFWWYAMSFCWIIWAIVLTERESLTWVIVSLIVYLVFLSFLGRINVFSYVFFNPLYSFLAVLGYFVIGVIWSFVKWWLKVKETAQRFEEAMDKFLKEHQPKEGLESVIPMELQKSERSGRILKDEWQSHIQFKDDLKKPLAVKNKEKIAIWIIYWPFSFLWSLINDFVKRLAEQFVIRFQKIYQKISDNAFKDLEPRTLSQQEIDE